MEEIARRSVSNCSMLAAMTRRQFVLSSIAAFARSAFAGEPSSPGVRIQRTPVESTSLASIGYDRATKLLEIEFRSGAVYRYLAVPEAVHRAFMTADSKGRYFAQHVRGRYDFQRVREVQP